MLVDSKKILDTFVGNRITSHELLKTLNKSSFSGVWLLKGPKGIGKAKLAVNIISELLNISYNESVKEIFHPDLFILKKNLNDKKYISVENVRKIASFLSKTSIKGTFKLVLIDSLSDMNLHGYNVLLKTIEEYSLETSFFNRSHDNCYT